MAKSGASKGARKINAFRDGDFQGAIALNAGPSTPIKYYPGMGFQPFYGGGRIGKVRPKPGVSVKDIYGK